MSLSDAKAAAVVHYPLGEASGNIVDSIGANDLAETGGTIATTAGKFGDCRDFEAGDTEYGESADTADLSVGDILWFATVWVNAETLSGFPLIFRKGANGAANRAFALYVNTDESNKPTFQASNGGAAVEVPFGSGLSTSTWHLIGVRHDPTADTIGISLDGGNFVDAAFATGIQDEAGTFQLGGGSDQSLYWDGLIDDFVIGKGYLFTNADASDLWDSGTGVAFTDWDASSGGELFGGSRMAAGAMNLSGGLS
jgi:hypothetical protein